MNRKLIIALAAAGIGATVAVTAGALIDRTDPLAEQLKREQRDRTDRPSVPQPDTKSPNWRFLSEDTGMMLRDDPRLGLRARLYVRVGGEWRPVAADGPADIGGILPAK